MLQTSDGRLGLPADAFLPAELSTGHLVAVSLARLLQTLSYCGPRPACHTVGLVLTEAAVASPKPAPHSLLLHLAVAFTVLLDARLLLPPSLTVDLTSNQP